MSNLLKVTIGSAKNVVIETLTKCGVSYNDTQIILDTILFANKRGVATHGIGRLPLYVQKIEAGHYNPKDNIEILNDNNAYALLDAHNGFGQIAAYKATNIGLHKAKEFGISIVGVRNSNNFGTAGYFGNMASRAGCAALVFANAAPAIAPTGGNKLIFGTNPICFSFPGVDDYDPIILDMATTVVARGKIRLAAKNGEKIPFDWAIGPDGQPTDDPLLALQGSLLPIGGYKGYGLSMFVDIFAGMLTGSHYAGEVKNLSNMQDNSGNGHLFIIIDVSKFMQHEELRERIQHLYSSVKACGEKGKVFMPGEIENLRMKENTNYLLISPKQFEEINNIAAELGSSNLLECID